MSAHPGERNGKSLWTNDQAKRIREYRAEGFSYDDLKIIFGGSRSTLVDVCLGHSYKEAGGPIAAKNSYHRSTF